MYINIRTHHRSNAQVASTALPRNALRNYPNSGVSNPVGLLVLFGGGPAALKDGREDVRCWFPAHGPTDSSFSGRVQASGDKVEALECGLLGLTSTVGDSARLAQLSRSTGSVAPVAHRRRSASLLGGFDIGSIVAERRRGVPIARLATRFKISDYSVRMIMTDAGMAPTSKLADQMVDQIRQRYAAGDSVMHSARYAEVSQTAILMLLRSTGCSSIRERRLGGVCLRRGVGNQRRAAGRAC